MPTPPTGRTVGALTTEQESSMPSISRLITTAVAAVLTAFVVTLGSAAAASAAPAAPVETLSQVNCSNIRELGTSKVVRDKGMNAFTVRQYIGWCWDSSGSAWMNFASVYVWSQYHSLGFAYRAQVGIVVGGGSDAAGYVVGDNRARLTYSVPVRTTSQCTQGR